MKFSTTPILLTSLALSSASALAAPVQTPNNLEVRSPNPDDFESPLLGSTNSPLLGGTSDEMGKKGWGKAAFDLGQGRPRNLQSGGNAGRSWSMKRQLAASNATPLSPLPDASTLTNNVQQQAQGTVQGLQAGLNGLLPNVNTNNLPLPNLANPLGGLGLGSTNQLGGTVTGLTGTAGGLTGGLTNSVSGLTGTTGGLTGGPGGLSGTVGGLSGSLGGLTSTAGGVVGAVGGLTGTVNGLTGSMGGPSLNGLTGQLAGLTNGLPAPAAIVDGLPVVGGIANGLPVVGGLGAGSIGNTINGAGGTANNLLGSATTGNVGLGGVTSTLGGLGLGDATRQLSGASGALGSLTGSAGILSSTAQGGSPAGLGSTLSGLQGGLGSTSFPTSVPSVGQVTGSVMSQENHVKYPGSQALGNIVQDLGNNTYLLSSGQVLNLPSQLSASLPSSTQPTVQPSTGSLTSLLSQGLSVAQVNGRMYVLNSLGQAIAALPDSTKLSNVADTGVGSYYQSPDQGASTNSTGIPVDITHEAGYNGPSLNGLTPEPSATDLIAQAMSGTEQTTTYSALPADALTEAVGVSSSAPWPNVYHGNQRTASHSLPMPTATSSSTITQPIIAALPTAAMTGGMTDAEWTTASASSTAPTTSVTVTSDSEAWGEWMSAGTTTTLWSGADALQTGAPLGAVGSEMVPQMSSGLA